MRNRLLVILIVLAVFTMGARLVPGMKNLVTDYSHHENHGGNFYSMSLANTTGSGETNWILLNTPSGGTHAHVLVNIKASGEAYYEIWEYPTITAPGAATEETSHNRENLKTASVEVTIPSTWTGGDKLDGLTTHIGAGQKGEGEHREEHELILNTSSFYVINAVSEAATNDMNVIVTWYESSDYY